MQCRLFRLNVAVEQREIVLDPAQLTAPRQQRGLAPNRPDVQRAVRFEQLTLQRDEAEARRTDACVRSAKFARSRHIINAIRTDEGVRATTPRSQPHSVVHRADDPSVGKDGGGKTRRAAIGQDERIRAHHDSRLA